VDPPIPGSPRHRITHRQTPSLSPQAVTARVLGRCALARSPTPNAQPGLGGSRRRTFVCAIAGVLAALVGGCGSGHHKVAALDECPGGASYSLAQGCSSSQSSPPSTVHTFPEVAPPAPRLPTVLNRSTRTYAANPPGIKKPPKRRPANAKTFGPKTPPASVARAAPTVLALSKYRAPELAEADLNAPTETLTPVVTTLNLRKSSPLSSPPVGNYTYRYPSGTTFYGSVDTPAHYYLYPTGSYRYCATAGSAACISAIPTASSGGVTRSFSSTASSTDYAYQVSQSAGYYYTTGIDSYVWTSVATSSYYYVPSAGMPEYYWTPHAPQQGYYYQPASTHGYFWDNGGRNWSYYPERESTAHYIANEEGLVGYVNEEAMYRYEAEGEGWQQVPSSPELEEAAAPEESYPEEQEETSSTSEEQPPAPSEPEAAELPPLAETAPPGTTPSTPETPQLTVPELPPTPTLPPEPPPPPQEPQPPSSGEDSEGETTQQDAPPEEPSY
jgi:hypothetical protein